MARIKRSLQLKKKIAQSYQVSRDFPSLSQGANSRAGGSDMMMQDVLEQSDAHLADLSSISIVDPTKNVLDKKQIAKLRAKQLEISNAERQAKRNKVAEEGAALLSKEKANRQRAASEAKQRIQLGLKVRE